MRACVRACVRVRVRARARACTQTHTHTLVATEITLGIPEKEISSTDLWPEANDTPLPKQMDMRTQHTHAHNVCASACALVAHVCGVVTFFARVYVFARVSLGVCGCTPHNHQIPSCRHQILSHRHRHRHPSRRPSFLLTLLILLLPSFWPMCG